MSWSQVIDQRRVVEALRRALAADRVPHAYLFHGPDGTGKRAAALALAQALECQQRAPGSGDPCGACPACQKVARMIHPDVHLYLPYPKKKSTSAEPPDDYAERIARLATQPYAVVDYARRPTLDDPEKTSNKQVSYPVGAVGDGGMRQFMHELRYAPAEGRYKVGVFVDADAMHEAAANAFLKLLEEPSPRTVLVLTASRPDRLLPTILSRCQRLRFDLLAPEAIEQALAEHTGEEPAQAALLARMADGSFSRALALAESTELAARRQLVLDFLRAAFAGHADRLSDLIEEMEKLGREGLKEVLALMLTWVRDLLLVRTAGTEAALVNVDQREAVRRFVQNLPHARLDAMTALVEHATELVERNVNLSLILTVLADALRAAMQGRHRRRLFAPLAEPAEV